MKSNQRAKELRGSASIPERTLWKLLRNHRVLGAKFRRQHPVGPYVADFYCAEARLVVEVDGWWSHASREKADRQRDDYMARLGMQVLRIPVRVISIDPATAISWIEQALRKASPSPQPSPCPRREREPEAH